MIQKNHSAAPSSSASPPSVILSEAKNLPPPPPRQSTREKARQTILLLLLALVSISAASYAWFSLSANTRVRSMNLDITSGVNLRFDTVAHNQFTDYVKTLTFTEIANQIRSAFGYDPAEGKLEPVTTGDGTSFQTEKGAAVDATEGNYLEFTLHFMATQDMEVHLTSENSDTAEDGTLVEGLNGGTEIAQALRISFTTEGGTAIYQPAGSSAGTFTLATAQNMQYNDTNMLFSLISDTDKEVTVRVWLEGTDAACTDDLRGSDYRIRLRFQGTGPGGEPLE